MEDLDRVHVHQVASVAFHEACDQDVAFQDDGWDDGEEDACVDEVADGGEEEVDEEPASLDLDRGVDASDGAGEEVVHVHEDHGDEAWIRDGDDHSYAVTVDPLDDLDLVRCVALDALVADQEGHKHSVQEANGVPESLRGEDEVTDEDLGTPELTRAGATAPNSGLVPLIPGCSHSDSSLEMYLTSWSTFLPSSSSAQLCNPPCCFCDFSPSKYRHDSQFPTGREDRD